jgi:uncharacterized protein involved in exopolysaccharide biosynthesis
MSNQQGQAFEDLRNTISECLRILRHRWQVSLVGLCFVGSLAFWFSQQLPREYAASTIFERRDDVVLQNLIQANSPYGFDHLKTTMSMDMTGARALLRALITAGILPEQSFAGGSVLGEPERAWLETAAARFKVTPDVRLMHSSASLDTIRLACTANDPVVARRVVVALRDNYIADTRERIREILRGTQEFFAGEVKRLERQIAATEGALREGLDGFPGLDPTDPVGVGNRLELLRTQRDNWFQRKTVLEAEIAARESFLQERPTNESDEATVDERNDTTLNRAIDQAQREIVRLITEKRMTVEHPTVKAARDRLQQLELLRDSLAAQPLESLPTPPPTEVDRQWRAQQSRVEMELQSLRKQSTVVEQQLSDAELRVGRFQDLYGRLVQRDGGLQTAGDKRAEALRELSVWQGHLIALERVVTAESGERGTQFALLEEPDDDVHPSKPRVASVFVVCSGLGLAAAALLVALAELLDRSFRSVAQITRVLGIPVLECVGVVPTPRERRRALLRKLFWAPMLSALVLSLIVSAAFAYTSLEMPALHQRTLERVAGALQSAGLIHNAPAGETLGGSR